MTARYETWVCGCWFAGIAGSNSAGTCLCVCCECCVFCFLRRADHSSRGAVQMVVSEYDRETSDDVEALAYWGLLSHVENKID